MADGSDPRGFGPGRPSQEIWQDAMLAAGLLAVNPQGLGGIMLRARPGPARERWMTEYVRLRGPGPDALRVPVSVDDERLLGGLDLAATLAMRKPVLTPGLLETAKGRGLILPMAERAAAALGIKISAALDADRAQPFIGFDEGAEPDEQPPAALTERCAFRPDLSDVGVRELRKAPFTPQEIATARASLGDIVLSEALQKAIVTAAVAFGIHSMRAPQMAIAAARAIAALNGSETVEELEAQAAVRLVLAWRATTLPQPPASQEQHTDTPPPDHPGDTEAQDSSSQERPQPEEVSLPDEMLIEAAEAVLPPTLFAELMAGAGRKFSNAPAGMGEASLSFLRGRPLAPRPGRRAQGARLDLIATLRTAAPWQELRRSGIGSGQSGVVVMPDDFRIKRFRRRAESALIFVVDASGSAAAARLAEVKGAVELMLADAYQRREQVALVSFRGSTAQLVLPMTRSLLQAKRRLKGVPGGGGTPLASGLVLARDIAVQARRGGMTPYLIVLTDGRANIALNGTAGRVPAAEDARDTARLLRAEAVSGVLIDTANRPQAPAEALAAEMGVRYIPLPRAGAQSMARAVQISISG